ncbi:MAG: hypothetical protein RDU20_19490 [Desulfomonilaceae bacterium]|nr:hypothetical protein [Desulfomonilaceae bacterium]
MTDKGPFRIVAQRSQPDHKVQLVEDCAGAYYLRKVSADEGTTLSNAPVHANPSVLAEAREWFPDLLPFGGVPVDAT